MPQVANNLTIKLDTSPSGKKIATIYNGLKHYNLAELGNLTEQDIACFAVNDQGEISGGVTAQYRHQTLQINYFWIHLSLRNSGLGTQLFNALENDTINKNLHAICLDTYSFQAPGFYLNLGFSEVGRYRDYIKPGVDKVFMQKILA